MKAWITAPFDDDGIKEIEIIGEPTDAFLQFYWKGHPYLNESYHWYREGHTWHRNYDDAVKSAYKNRSDRIAKAAAEIAHINGLAALTSKDREAT